MSAIQTESVSGFRDNYDGVLKKLSDGPVLLLQRSKLAAILVAPEEWNALQERLEYLEDLAAVYKHKWEIATGQDEMIIIDPDTWEEIEREENKILA